MTSPAELAGRLTDGERRALLDAAEAGMFFRVPTHYKKRRANGGLCRITMPTLCNLHKAGLIEFQPPRLTPLGLAVRAHLEKQHD